MAYCFLLFFGVFFFFLLFCCLLIFFQINFLKKQNHFRNTIRMSNSLDPDQARQSSGMFAISLHLSCMRAKVGFR